VASWVWGIEADGSWGEIKSRTNLLEQERGAIETLALFDQKLTSFGTIRGRLGYTWKPLPPGGGQGPGQVPDAWWGEGFGRAPRRSQRQLQARALDARERGGPEGRSGGDGRDQGSASGGER
jgi:hypothetical protein